MPKLNIDVNDELYNNLKKLSEQFNLPLEELMKRLLIHGSRGVIEEQILKNYPQSNISLVLPSQSSTTTGITSSSIDALFQQALELRKQELLLRMLSPTPSTQTSPNPEIEILKKEIESLKEMNKSLIDQLTKKQEENKIDKLIKLVMKVTKSNQEVIEKLTKPKEGELPADVKKTIEDLNKQNAELKEKLKELAEAQKIKLL
jgi:gas vesicle protein